ncbi:MAG: hypothetical protein ACO1OB_27575 [Archangium sp.]
MVHIENSAWLASFDQRHLSGHSHVVLEFYDDVVEVICRELVFGAGEFELNRALATEPRFGSAYFTLALEQEKRGEVHNAIATWEKYLACAPHVNSTDYASRALESLRRKR